MAQKGTRIAKSEILEHSKEEVNGHTWNRKRIKKPNYTFP